MLSLTENVVWHNPYMSNNQCHNKAIHQTTSIETEHLKNGKQYDRHLVFWVKREELIQSLTLITIWRDMTGDTGGRRGAVLMRLHVCKGERIIAHIWARTLTTPQNKTTTHRTQSKRPESTKHWDMTQSLRRNTASFHYKSQIQRRLRWKPAYLALCSSKVSEHLKCNLFFQ